MKQLAQTTVAIMATLAMLVFLWWFRGVLLLLLVAITIATLVAPGIRRLNRRGLPRLLAIGVVYGALFVAAVAVLWMISGSLLTEWEQIARDVDGAHRHIRTHWTEGGTAQQYVAELLPPAEDLPQPMAPADGGAAVRGLVGIGGDLFRLSIAAFLTIVVSIYWSIDYWRIERLWLLLLPLDHRVRARRIWHQIQTEVGIYMRSELLQALIAGIVLGIAFWWSEFPYPVTLAAVISLTWLVPWLGPVLAVAAVWTASLLNFSGFTPVAMLARGVIGSGFALLLFVFLAFFVEPRIARHRRYSSLMMMLVTVVLLDWIGVAALFLGAPVAITLQILLGRLLFRSAADQPVHEPYDTAALRQRLDVVVQQLGRLDDPQAVALSNVAQRLDQLLSDAGPALEPESSKTSLDSPARQPAGGLAQGAQAVAVADSQA
jgi:putative permease